MATNTLTNRGLLKAVVLAFSLVLAYRFVATVAAIVLLLATGLLLAVALSAPVEVLYRRKVPRPVAVILIVIVVLVVLAVTALLLLPTLVAQISQLLSTLPNAFSQFVGQAQQLASRLGIQVGGGGGGGPSAQALADVARRLLGGLLGLFSGVASFLDRVDRGTFRTALPGGAARAGRGLGGKAVSAGEAGPGRARRFRRPARACCTGWPDVFFLWPWSVCWRR